MKHLRWINDHEAIIDQDGDPVAILPIQWPCDKECEYHGHTKEECAKNERAAYLIAAAPELLDALKKASARMSALERWAESNPEKEIVGSYIEEMEETIKKAEGRS